MGNVLHRKRKLNCKSVQAHLAAYVQGELSRPDERGMRAHLLTCDNCLDTLRALETTEARRETESIDGQLYAEAKRSRVTLSFAVSDHIQARVYRRMRRALIMQRTTQVASRISALIIMLVLAFAVIALFGNRQDETTTVTEQSAAVDALDEKVVITMADYEFTRELYAWRIDQFRKQHPEIDVQFVTLDPNLSVGDQQLASIADTIALPSLPSSTQANVFLDLQPFIDDAALDPDDFWPGVLEGGCDVSGRMVGLPTSVNPNLIYFDTVAFDAVGVSRPAPGWTWNDFRLAAQTLASNGRYGFVDQGQPLKLLGPVVDTYTTDAGIAVDRLSEALGWYVDFAREGVIHTSASAGSGAGLIRDGRAAMWVGTLADYERLDALLNIEIGIAPYPLDDVVPNSTPVSAACVAISAGTLHPQEAWIWLRFLATEPLQREVGDTAVRIDVAEARGFYAYDRIEAPDVFRFALTHAWYGDLFESTLVAVDNALGQALAREAELAFALASAPVQSTSAPSAQDEVSFVVATPIPTPTSVPDIAPAREVASVNYYAGFLEHPNASAIKSLAGEFNRTHSNIAVNVVDSLDQYMGPQGLMVDAPWYSNHFDCFALDSGAARFYSAQLFYNLNPFIDSDVERTTLLKDFDRALLDSASVAGALYALPVASRPIMIYYNADHLAAQGLEPPAFDWTVDDFWALVAAATTDTTYGFTAGWRGFNGIEFLFAVDDTQLYDVSVDPPIVNFADSDVIGIVSMLVNAARDDIVFPIKDGGTRVDFGNLEQRLPLIESGDVALWTSIAGFQYGLLTGQPEIPLRFKVGVAPLPMGVDPLPPSDHSTALYISRHSDHAAACWEWIKFLSARPNAFRGIPARASLLESPDFEAAVGADVAATYRAMHARPSRTPGSLLGEIKLGLVWRWWEDALTQAFDGKDPAAALAEAQRKAEAYLACVATIPEELYDGNDLTLQCAVKADPDYLLAREE